MTRMAGQGLAEFAAFAFVLVLLGAGLHVVARYQSIQRQSVLAARHAAFRQAWLPAPAAQEALQRSLRAQHFDRPGWTDPAGRAALLSPRDVALSLAQSQAPGRAAGLVDHVLAPLVAPGGFLAAGFGFGGPGYHVADVSVAIPPVRGWAPFDRSGLALAQRAAILGNAWNAEGPAQVRARSEGLVPTAALRQPASLLQPFAAVLSLLEPSLADYCPGLIEPDRVPADRLSPSPVAVSPPVCR
jgi:hypothetical protein